MTQNLNINEIAWMVIPFLTGEEESRIDLRDQEGFAPIGKLASQEKMMKQGISKMDIFCLILKDRDAAASPAFRRCFKADLEMEKIRYAGEPPIKGCVGRNVMKIVLCLENAIPPFRGEQKVGKN